MQVNSSNAMELEPHRWYADASNLGLNPGSQFPAYIKTNLGNGKDFAFVQVDGNGSHKYVQQYGCLTLTVWND